MPARHAILASILLTFLASHARAELEVAPSGYEVTPIVLVSASDGGLAVPASGTATNTAGDVLFTLSEPGGEVLFLRHQIGVRVRVLGAGDPLAGSKVSRLVASPTSLDEFRQILVYAELENGQVGLFRLSPPPSPFAVTPKWGNREEPIAFHLLGDGFAPGVAVSFGDVKVGMVTVISRTELSGIVPAGADAGVVDVTVARPSGAKGVRKQAFEFRDAPTTGCRGLWPDHRPPLKTSAVAIPWVAAVATLAFRRPRR